jgi:hypothetical protein
MNKIVIRVVVFLVVIGLIILILFRNKSPFGKDNSSFASEPQKEITKIEFSQGSQRLFLLKEGERWLLNGKSETRKSGILYILGILRELKIKSPVSSELFESEITARGINPVRVKVYERRKLLNSFLVYKTPSNTYGNIMKIKEWSKPFIVHVPGFEGDIGSAFTLKELFWQPYTIFNLLPSEIASIYFENISDTASSFSIVNNNRKYILSGKSGRLTGWDTTRVTRYLSYFTRVPFESWAFDIPVSEKKVIESQLPIYRITLNSTGGRQLILNLWDMTTMQKGEKIKDSDRLLGKTENSDELLIIKYFDIDPLIKKKSYFFPE